MSLVFFTLAQHCAIIGSKICPSIHLVPLIVCKVGVSVSVNGCLLSLYVSNGDLSRVYLTFALLGRLYEQKMASCARGEGRSRDAK